tara:strand:- start:47 stop:595 length:549 start_codon:yes stop_codon:yes gene_type:complete
MVDNTEGAHKISVVEGIFTEKQRKKILEECKPLLIDGDILSLRKAGKTGLYPGKQSYPTVHLHPDFKWVFAHIVEMIRQTFRAELKVDGAWFNWTNGDAKYINWHNHWPHDYSAVYYLKTNRFFGSGTLFADYGYVKAKQNSLVLFPSHLVHSAPVQPKFVRYDRYALAMDFILPHKPLTIK